MAGLAGTGPIVPATLLLEERALLAMNAVAGLADPNWEAPFFSANLAAHPPYLQHGDWDYGSTHGRLTDACILARHMTGCDDFLVIERSYKEGLVALFAEDGLSYRRRNPHRGWEPNANLIDQRAVILALTTWYLDEGANDVRRLADRHVGALHRIAIKERDAWYYPASEYTPAGWPSQNAIALHLAPDPASFCGRLIMPLLRYHQATGNEQALELCLWFRRMLVDRSGVFNADGSFNDALAYRSGHFHTRLGTLDGLARLALHTSDHALTAFVRRSFDWALGQATSFGWTPGDLAGQRYEHETCSLVDMISTAIALARAGHIEYWGTAERFLRNHLAESQLLDVGWVEQGTVTKPGIRGWESYDRVGERVKGAFAGYGAPNDFVSDVALGRGHTNDVQACCVGSGIRGLFMGWDNAISGDESNARVNLMLSRATRYLSVSSHLPFEGRVDLTATRPLRRLSARVPSWAGHAQVRVTRDRSEEAVGAGGDRRSPDWAPDGYLYLNDVGAGERISITFPVPGTRTTEVAAEQEFLVYWRGDNVAGISPAGRYRPMYAAPPPEAPAPVRQWQYWVPTAGWHW